MKPQTASDLAKIARDQAEQLSFPSFRQHAAIAHPAKKKAPSAPEQQSAFSFSAEDQRIMKPGGRKPYAARMADLRKELQEAWPT